ncbi:hypothetical protein BN59_02358 [Legionella massiliensis]|uniref:Uncharacterized protein n=1 Tax=Legionella massiliensis TaxID=1034943 RepID=A0A078KYQ9_9GAMM|nr:hypothetical protein BN59_02358 [Legionella massiliensis]CEE13799.1 hypothetical protein BN1094_02358 [Legionella massiliensis]
MLSIDYFLQVNSLFIIWPFYCIICLPIAYIISLLIPAYMRHQPPLTFLLLYILCVSIIGFGILISFIICLTLHYQKPVKKKNIAWSMVDQPDYQRPPVFENTVFGESSGFKIATSANFPKLLRQKLLVAANQFGAKNVNKINALALGDEMDEVRLFAQSLMDKRERSLLNLIKFFLTELSRTEDPIKIAYYKKQIAQIMWEQVYNYLVMNENLRNTLLNIKKNALQALEVLPDDIELPLLLAKVALQQSDIKEAKQWLKLAVENEAPEYKILSCLAEIEYIEKNYSAIKDTLRPCQRKGLISLEPLISFWVTHD